MGKILSKEEIDDALSIFGSDSEPPRPDADVFKSAEADAITRAREKLRAAKDAETGATDRSGERTQTEQEDESAAQAQKETIERLQGYSRLLDALEQSLTSGLLVKAEILLNDAYTKIGGFQIPQTLTRKLGGQGIVPLLEEMENLGHRLGALDKLYIDKKVAVTGGNEGQEKSEQIMAERTAEFLAIQTLMDQADQALSKKEAASLEAFGPQIRSRLNSFKDASSLPPEFLDKAKKDAKILGQRYIELSSKAGALYRELRDQEEKRDAATNRNEGQAVEKFKGRPEVLKALSGQLKEFGDKVKAQVLAKGVKEETLQKAVGNKMFALMSGDIDAYLGIISSGTDEPGIPEFKTLFTATARGLRDHFLAGGGRPIAIGQLKAAFGSAFDDLGFDEVVTQTEPKKPEAKPEPKPEAKAELKETKEILPEGLLRQLIMDKLRTSDRVKSIDNLKLTGSSNKIDLEAGVNGNIKISGAIESVNGRLRLVNPKVEAGFIVRTYLESKMPEAISGMTSFLESKYNKPISSLDIVDGSLVINFGAKSAETQGQPEAVPEQKPEKPAVPKTERRGWRIFGREKKDKELEAAKLEADPFLAFLKAEFGNVKGVKYRAAIAEDMGKQEVRTQMFNNYSDYRAYLETLPTFRKFFSTESTFRSGPILPRDYWDRYDKLDDAEKKRWNVLFHSARYGNLAVNSPSRPELNRSAVEIHSHEECGQLYRKLSDMGIACYVSLNGDNNLEYYVYSKLVLFAEQFPEIQGKGLCFVGATGNSAEESKNGEYSNDVRFDPDQTPEQFKANVLPLISQVRTDANAIRRYQERQARREEEKALEAERQLQQAKFEADPLVASIRQHGEELKFGDIEYQAIKAEDIGKPEAMPVSFNNYSEYRDYLDSLRPYRVFRMLDYKRTGPLAGDDVWSFRKGLSPEAAAEWSRVYQDARHGRLGIASTEHPEFNKQNIIEHTKAEVNEQASKLGALGINCWVYGKNPDITFYVQTQLLRFAEAVGDHLRGFTFRADLANGVKKEIGAEGVIEFDPDQSVEQFKKEVLPLLEKLK